MDKIETSLDLGFVFKGNSNYTFSYSSAAVNSAKQLLNNYGSTVICIAMDLVSPAIDYNELSSPGASIKVLQISPTNYLNALTIPILNIICKGELFWKRRQIQVSQL